MSDEETKEVRIETHLTEEIRKGGVGHNEVVPVIVVMTATGLQVAPEAPIPPDPGGPPPAPDQPSTPPQQQE